MEKQSIGIFDSGVGGTSIWSAISKLLPFENTIYLADSQNAPYGHRTADEIIALSVKNTEKLLDLNCKVIVVACNTATTNAIQFLRQQYDIPFIGIEPAIKPAALQTKTNTIGILATKGTLSSALFTDTATKYATHLDVIEIVGTGLVKQIEAGVLNGETLKKLLEGYLQPMIKKNIDHLVLGCTHYPLLTPLLKTMLPRHVKIIDSGAAVARQTKTVLQTNLITSNSPILGTHNFYTNGNMDVLINILQTFHFNGSVQKIKF